MSIGFFNYKLILIKDVVTLFFFLFCRVIRGFFSEKSGPEVIKNFMLNSAELEFFPAHKY